MFSILVLGQNLPGILKSFINFQISVIQFYAQHTDLIWIAYNCVNGFQIQCVSIYTILNTFYYPCTDLSLASQKIVYVCHPWQAFYPIFNSLFFRRLTCYLIKRIKSVNTNYLKLEASAFHLSSFFWGQPSSVVLISFPFATFVTLLHLS